MEITERLTERGADEQSLNALEARIGSKLPDDYRAFLQEFNGGRPNPRDFDALDGDEGSSVRFFFTLDETESHYCILRKLEVFSERIPGGTLPIGCDSFGNLVLIDVGARSNGTVYFWDHENENMDGDPHWDNVYPVALSFSDFIRALK